MRYGTILLICMAVVLTGCMHGRGMHNIPMSRDYKNLEKTDMRDAAEQVSAAHRVGAGVFAPYEYESAAHYRDWAAMEKAEGDRKGMWDYSNLAAKYAADAKEKGAGVPDKGPMAMPKNQAACLAEYDRLVARYRELNPCKAELVAPVPYAHIEANLSIAEHELMETRDYPHAVPYLAQVEADIDAIWAHDADGDGVKDMEDGEPWIPEDKDGFQDGDGIPEPKPYPVLTAVHFDTNSAKLSADAKGYLRGIARMLNNGYSEATLHIEGYTDSDASDTYNMGLSKRRVDAVRQYLTENGVSAGQISAGAKGEANPVADNKTAKGKAQNRRVEIWLDSPDVKSPYCQ